VTFPYVQYEAKCCAPFLPNDWNFSLPSCKEYIEARTQRWEQRKSFRQQCRRSHPRRPVRYPVELSDFPPFTEWLTSAVTEAECSGHPVEHDVVQYKQPVQRDATSHYQMYCHGKHFRVRCFEGSLVPRDSAVVASFSRKL
jgi:hypothetical protein